MQPTTTPRDTTPAPLPSSEVRGLISLFLFIHLFAVAVVLASYTRPSQLQERLRTVLAPYLTTLNFDLNPNAYSTGRFYLTHDLPIDVDAVIHVDATLPDGEARSLTIPEPGLWPPERRRHYQALANAANTLVEGDVYEGALPKAVAGAILRTWGATGGTVRIERHLPLQMEDANSSDSAKRDPFSPAHYSTVYEARVLISPSGQVDLIKKVAAGEVAPVDKNASEKQPAQRPPGDEKPGDNPSTSGEGQVK